MYICICIRMACERISGKNLNCPIRIVPMCCENCYISFLVLKTDDEIKVRRRIFTFKTLFYVSHIMRVRFILRFLLILLASILFSVSNRFFSTRLMKFAISKNRLHTVCASDSIQQERLPVNLEVGKIYF